MMNEESLPLHAAFSSPHFSAPSFRFMKHRLLRNTFAALLALGLSTLVAADQKHILMIAGKPSHGPAQHEHNAGVQLLAKCLRESGLPLDVKFHLNGEWPSPEEMGAADTIVIYSDGGGGHPALQDDHLATLDKEMKHGCGLVCLRPESSSGVGDSTLTWSRIKSNCEKPAPIKSRRPCWRHART